MTAITAREHTQLLTALRSTTMRVPEIATATGRTAGTIEKIAQANGINLKGRK